MSGLAVAPAHGHSYLYMDNPADRKSFEELVRGAPDGVLEGGAQDLCIVRDLGVEAFEYEGDVKAADGQDVRRMKYTLSNEKRDRYRDSITLAGWQLDNYHRPKGYGPVLLFHGSRSFPIARGIAELKKKSLQGYPEFPAEGVDDVADKAVFWITFSALNACSVGFRSLKAAWNSEEGGVDWMKVELLEWSIVNVGAHQDALVAAKEAGVDVDFVAKMAQEQLITLRGEGRFVEAEEIDRVTKALGLESRGFELFEMPEADLASAIKEAGAEESEEGAEADEPKALEIPISLTFDAEQTKTLVDGLAAIAKGFDEILEKLNELEKDLDASGEESADETVFELDAELDAEDDGDQGEAVTIEEIKAAIRAGIAPIKEAVERSTGAVL